MLEEISENRIGRVLRDLKCMEEEECLLNVKKSI
jgi:hypothetical protein